jgi:hypothetical protein
MKSKKEIDWSEAEERARASLNRSKSAIEATAFGTPANWSRPVYNKPLIAPDPSPPDTHVKTHKLNKKQRKKYNKTFVPKQKAKARKSDESGGLPVVNKNVNLWVELNEQDKGFISNWKWHNG